MQLFPKKRFDFAQYTNTFKVGLQITKSTKIVSMGSCFARAIREYFLSKGYNYLTGELNKDCWINKKLFPGDKGRHKASHGSIAWERVYHTHTFLQIIKYSFIRPYNRIYRFEYNGQQYYTDLLRTRMVYPDYDTAVADIDDHIKISRQILMDAELLIFTLGLTEVWRYKDIILGSLFKRIPINKEFIPTGYPQNLANLAEAYDILKHHNPRLKILFTVSPVHLLATNREDLDVISASCVSKSILRATADQATRWKDCYYFPSYEIANILFPLLGKDSYPDNHHVSSELVEHVMKAFEQNCLV